MVPEYLDKNNKLFPINLKIIFAFNSKVIRVFKLYWLFNIEIHLITCRQNNGNQRKIERKLHKVMARVNQSRRLGGQSLMAETNQQYGFQSLKAEISTLIWAKIVKCGAIKYTWIFTQQKAVLLPYRLDHCSSGTLINKDFQCPFSSCF